MLTDCAVDKLTRSRIINEPLYNVRLPAAWQSVMLTSWLEPALDWFDYNMDNLTNVYKYDGS